VHDLVIVCVQSVDKMRNRRVVGIDLDEPTINGARAAAAKASVHPIVVTSLAAYRAMRNPDAVLAYLEMRHQVAADRAAAFIADLEARDRDCAFVATSIIYVVSGRRPA
jgi:hypothetical protein